MAYPYSGGSSNPRVRFHKSFTLPIASCATDFLLPRSQSSISSSRPRPLSSPVLLLPVRVGSSSYRSPENKTPISPSASNTPQNCIIINGTQNIREISQCNAKHCLCSCHNPLNVRPWPMQQTSDCINVHLSKTVIHLKGIIDTPICVNTTPSHTTNYLPQRYHWYTNLCEYHPLPYNQLSISKVSLIHQSVWIPPLPYIKLSTSKVSLIHQSVWIPPPPIQPTIHLIGIIDTPICVNTTPSHSTNYPSQRNHWYTNLCEYHTLPYNQISISKVSLIHQSVWIPTLPIQPTIHLKGIIDTPICVNTTPSHTSNYPPQRYHGLNFGCHNPLSLHPFPCKIPLLINTHPNKHTLLFIKSDMYKTCINNFVINPGFLKMFRSLQDVQTDGLVQVWLSNLYLNPLG